MARFLDGTLSGGDEDDMRKHLGICPECRLDLSEMEQILAGADAVHDDIRKVMAGIDWEALPARIADAAWSPDRGRRKRGETASFRKTIFSPRWRPVYAGALAGLVIGAAGMLLILKPQMPRSASGAKFFASRDVIARAESELARQETLDYLQQSQFLILDLIQNGSGGGQPLRDKLAVQKARELLSKKRYINPQLDTARMVKARAICNQIEILFLELSQFSDELSEEELSRLKEFVEQKQLLLKIKLLRKELDENEV